MEAVSAGYLRWGKCPKLMLAQLKSCHGDQKDSSIQATGLTSSVLISLPGRHEVRGKLNQNPSVFTLHNWRHRGQGL